MRGVPVPVVDVVGVAVVRDGDVAAALAVGVVVAGVLGVRLRTHGTFSLSFLPGAGFASVTDGIRDGAGDVFAGDWADPFASAAPQLPGAQRLRLAGGRTQRVHGQSSLAGSHSSCPAPASLTHKHMCMPCGMGQAGRRRGRHRPAPTCVFGSPPARCGLP